MLTGKHDLSAMPRRGTCRRLTPIPVMLTSSSHAKRNPRDEVAAKTVLQAVEDFFAAITDNFVQPRAAIDRDKESAFVQAGRLGVSREVGVDEMVPDFEDFRFGAATVETQIGENFRQDRADRRRRFTANFFERVKVQAAPVGEHALS